MRTACPRTRSSLTVVTLCGLLAGCTLTVALDDDGADPCADITCGDHGSCVVTDGAAACECDTGYRVEGLDCVAEPSDDPDDALPVLIQAEDFDDGGEAVAYHDAEPENLFDTDYRPGEGVDVKVCSDTGGGYAVGWTVAGEWINYTVDFTAAGTFALEVRVATAEDGKRLHVELDGNDITGPLDVPVTGAWDTAFTSLTVGGVSVAQGTHVVRLVFDTGAVDVNFLAFTPAGADPCVGVTCSDHGSCVDADGAAACACDDGYHAVGLECVATGTTFRVANGKIYDPDGKQYIARGINIGDPSIASQITTLFPGINFVRVAIGYDSPETWASFIETMTAQKIVCEIEHHPWPLPDAYTDGQLDEESSWYAAWAAAYGDNPYVWFGTMNEPQGGAGMAAITAQQVATYDAIRGAGADNLILLEAGAGGGNPGTVGAGSGLTESAYATMTGVVWDLHFYGWMSAYSTDQSVVNATLLGAPDNQTGILAAQAIQSADGVIPVINAEFGVSTAGTATDANADQDVYAVTTWAVTNGHTSGYAGWHWNADPYNALQSGGALTGWGETLRAAIQATAAYADSL